MTLKTATLKAYRGTNLYALRQLLAEQTRWQRKVTIATNKLADVRKRIDALAEALATPKGSDETK